MSKNTDNFEKVLLEELMELYKGLLVPFMKVERDMPFPTTPVRNETDGEHAFSLSVVAITIAERLELKLDTGLIAKYALVHDLVEAYSGDISVRDKEKYSQKHIKEAEALQKIEEKYKNSAGWIIPLIHSYENRADDESKFVYAVDIIIAAIVRLSGDGINWTKYYPEIDGSSFHRVVGVLRSKTEIFPDLLPLFDYVHGFLDEQRLIYHERENSKL